MYSIGCWRKSVGNFDVRWIWNQWKEKKKRQKKRNRSEIILTLFLSSFCILIYEVDQLATNYHVYFLPVCLRSRTNKFIFQTVRPNKTENGSKSKCFFSVHFFERLQNNSKNFSGTISACSKIIKFFQHQMVKKNVSLFGFSWRLHCIEKYHWVLSIKTYRNQNVKLMRSNFNELIERKEDRDIAT